MILRSVKTDYNTITCSYWEQDLIKPMVTVQITLTQEQQAKLEALISEFCKPIVEFK